MSIPMSTWKRFDKGRLRQVVIDDELPRFGFTIKASSSAAADLLSVAVPLVSVSRQDPSKQGQIFILKETTYLFPG